MNSKGCLSKTAFLYIGRTMKKVELLSPAGGYETMVGAFNAGADAVYLGGSKFGARAYADNFDRDQVLDAISYAHLHGKRIYMTVNTLVKEGEFGQLYDFMLPYAEKNLDGVIVQDYGVMRLIGKEFPAIELHASTQQTVTGVYGAKLLKDLGCCRVVPARELSLQEMSAIRNEAGVEVEAFIHGAMCYCYSGICLFSSIVGGRSGNRGRCAQPCRLPYRMSERDREQYPLSLKDMSTIGIIPELIEAGIDSFKIEGRMKKPEYSAGVTALYRKYIDRYYADPNAPFEVSKEDMETLKSLYQRTGISEGYYHRHNDKSMVTISSPAYNATSEEILADVHKKYLTSELKLKCDLYCELKVGTPARLTMTAYKGDEVFYAEEYGNAVQAASKRPMEEADIRKQLGKLGGTPFEAGNIDITIDDNGAETGIFMAVSELNELRRRLVTEVLMQIEERALDSSRTSEASDEADGAGLGGANSEGRSSVAHFADYGLYSSPIQAGKGIHVLVNTREQLEAVLNELDNNTSLGKDGVGAATSGIQRIYVDSNLFLSLETSLVVEKAKKLELFISLPYVTREEEWDGTREIDRVLEKMSQVNEANTIEFTFAGLLVRNLEQLGYLREIGYSGKVILDYSMYVWNREAGLELLDSNGKDFMISEFTVPYELSFAEMKDMTKALKNTVDIPISYNIYGHLPMMISAGCIKKTTDKCSGKLHELHSEQLNIIDRMNNTLPVTCNCRNCYNVIWNAHPTSLHKRLDKVLLTETIDNLRLDFTVESGKRTAEVLQYYIDRLNGVEPEDIFKKEAFTAGHFSRGVE